MLIKIGKATYENLKVVSEKTKNNIMTLLNEAVDDLINNEVPLTHIN